MSAEETKASVPASVLAKATDAPLVSVVIAITESEAHPRTVIEGFGFIGLDTLGDGEIDCFARGDFEAFKSGF
jgi:hypothetical protein